MSARWYHRLVPAALACLVVLSFAFALRAAKEYQPPKTSPAGTYAARDAHPKEKVTIAAVPYDTPEKLGIFRLKYLEHSILPIYLVVTNEGSAPVTLRSMTVQLTTSDRRAKLSPLEAEDIFRHLQHIQRPSNVTINPLPIPHTAKPKGGFKQEDRDEVERARFQAYAVDPNATQAGFLFFDISGLQTPLPQATLYITGVTDSNGNELMYFEIPLDQVLAK